MTPFPTRFWPDCWLRPPNPMMVPNPHQYEAHGDKPLSLTELHLLRPTFVWAPDIFFRP